MMSYYHQFLDYLQLRAIISNVDSPLDTPAELDIFIANSLYPEYLNRVTRDEQRVAAMAYKYQGSQMLETLEKYLMAPDSPVYQNYQSY